MRTMKSALLAASVAGIGLSAATAANVATYLLTYNIGASAFIGTVTTTYTANADGFFTIIG
ncbi:hypothetical protein [Sphingomonas sp. Leaf357]|uniref:hypothetical protein n=1 Tax=Sphingomonas sp. Leaf357 TaxID=1736350 RepID=UPI000AD8234D|nr:hypothetical protein [Sphingomonas sp. Leaf357]